MIMTTTESVAGRKAIESFGLIDGGGVFSPGFAKGISAAFSALSEGQVAEFEEVFRRARALARKEMVLKADRLGADAIVSIRYGTADIGNGLCEVVVYGTAVKLG